jgi:hypothetical protein
MILFVFEGGKAEPLVFDSLKKLFLIEEKVCVVTCKHDLPTLYSRLKKNGYDLFRSLPLKENGIVIPDGVRLDTLFSQIFLFFDYDFQNRIGLDMVNDVLEEMLEFFNDETENGKLYVNYPMVESLKYTKEMPDKEYNKYVASREDCVEHKFKTLAEAFAYAGAKQYRFIDLTKTPSDDVKYNWHLLMDQNVSKVNYICNGEKGMPAQKEEILQKDLFAAQRRKYVDVNKTVAILNSFPLFVYEYFPKEKFE